MIFHRSLQSLLRSRGKTALFSLLLFSLTLALSLGVGVWASIAQFLQDCDDFYTTVGWIEYMGTGYPDDSAYDSGMDRALESFQGAVIAQDEAVLTWETPARSLGTIDGFWRADTFMPRRMLSVLVIGNANYAARDDIYSMIVMRSLYSLKSEQDTILLVDGNFATFEPGHYYLVFGEVYYGSSPLLHLRVADDEALFSSILGTEIPRSIDITSEAGDGPPFVIPEDSPLTQIASTLPVLNNSLLVNGTNDLMALLPFHQQELYFLRGRPFTQEEVARGERVIVISDLVAARLGVDLGDTLDLSVAVSDRPGIENSYWVEDGFAYRGTFTVVGITNTVVDKSWYIYVPRLSGVPFSSYPVGYTVGRAVLRNEAAAGFYQRISSSLEDRFELTIYDQGYSTVATPYRMILRIAQIVTVVCLVMVLAVVALFGFLFVYRQQETGETMLMLGAGRGRVLAYLLYSAGFIALLACLTGGLAAFWLHGGIVDLVIRAADMVSLIDLRYSNANLSISRTLDFAPQLKLSLFLAVGAAVFVLSSLSCLAFSTAAMRRRRPGRKAQAGPRRAQRSSTLAGGSLKYALLSILRGRTRSLVVPLLAISMVVFLGQLARTSRQYQLQLEEIYQHSTLTGFFTDINGKQIGNQVLSAYDVGNLFRSGWVDPLSVSIGLPYLYLGRSGLADGTPVDIGPLIAPSNFFAFEALEERILRGPDLTATNNIQEAPEFYFTGRVAIDFLDGYDESFLAVPSGDPETNTCIVPSSFLQQAGIELGDTIRVAIDRVYFDQAERKRIFLHFDLRVIGSYEKQGSQDTIYAPLALLFHTPLIWDESQPTSEGPAQTFETGFSYDEETVHYLQHNTFHSASFTLVDPRALGSFKDYLASYGFSQVQAVSSVREFIVLKDASFNNAVASVLQQIRYIDTLYPILYALVGVIAGVASYLLVVSRKKELAILRGLGATRLETFLRLFLEHAILALLGVLAGLAVWRLVGGELILPHLFLSGGFLACYLLGCGLSVALMNRAIVLALLLDRD
jgi:ABC-type lipoprotein release transport system permease subunit